MSMLTEQELLDQKQDVIDAIAAMAVVAVVAENIGKDSDLFNHAIHEIRSIGAIDEEAIQQCWWACFVRLHESMTAELYDHIR